MTLSPCPSARPAARPTCSSSTPGVPRPRASIPKAAAALALFLASRENEGAILQTGFALPALQGFDNDPFFQRHRCQSKISKLIYQTATYGTADYYGGINDPKIKKAINDATAARLRQAAGSQGRRSIRPARKSIRCSRRASSRTLVGPGRSVGPVASNPQFR